METCPWWGQCAEANNSLKRGLHGGRGGGTPFYGPAGVAALVDSSVTGQSGGVAAGGVAVLGSLGAADGGPGASG